MNTQLQEVLSNFSTALMARINNIESQLGGSGGTINVSITGNAATATQLQNTITLTLGGDLSGSADFDGSQSFTLSALLSNTGVSAGTYNGTAGYTNSFTVDSRGRITSVGLPQAVVASWMNLTDKPTTVDGFGITDAIKAGANSSITSLTGLTTPLSADQGGTGISGYTAGDLLVAADVQSILTINAVEEGNVLLSAGVGVIPVYGKVNLASMVTGILGVGNGGLGTSDIPTMRTTLGLVPGVNVQQYNSELTALSGLSGVGIVRRTGASTYAIDATDYFTTSGGTFGGAITTSASTGTTGTSVEGLSGLTVIGGPGSDDSAFMAFKRTSSAGVTSSVYLGVELDGKLYVGGPAYQGNTYEVLHTGNFDAELLTITNIPNSALVNSSVTIGSTQTDLGATVTDIQGLTSVQTESLIVGSGVVVSTATTTVATTTANQELDSLPVASVGAVKYLIQMTYTSTAPITTSRQITEILMANDGTTSFITSYGDTATNGDLAQFTTDVSGGNMRLLVTPVNPGTKFVVHRTSFAPA